MVVMVPGGGSECGMSMDTTLWPSVSRWPIVASVGAASGGWADRATGVSCAG